MVHPNPSKAPPRPADVGDHLPGDLCSVEQGQLFSGQGLETWADVARQHYLPRASRPLFPLALRQFHCDRPWLESDKSSSPLDGPSVNQLGNSGV